MVCHLRLRPPAADYLVASVELAQRAAAVAASDEACRRPLAQGVAVDAQRAGRLGDAVAACGLYLGLDGGDHGVSSFWVVVLVKLPGLFHLMRVSVTMRRSRSMLVEYLRSSMKLNVLAIERTEVYREAG